jgi:hypothetical protein
MPQALIWDVSAQSAKPIVPKERPRGENVVDLMDAAPEHRRRCVGVRTFEEAGQETA